MSQQQQGFIDLSAADYHADKISEQPTLSSSVAQVLVTHSPLHAWFAHPRLNPNYTSQEKDTFDYGTAAHAMLLEGSQAGLIVVEADDWRTKAARELKERARLEGKTPILARQLAKVERMAKTAKEFIETTELAGIFSDGRPEQAIVFKVGGVLCRARLDWITNDNKIVLDYKSTGDASPEAFSRQIPKMDYHFQECFYQAGVEDATGDVPQFFFLAQETEPPFACSLHGTSAAMQEVALSQFDRACRLWAQCLSTGQWPGYGTSVHYAEPPTWMMAEHEAHLQEAA